jgi:putative copper resistance protein D
MDLVSLLQVGSAFLLNLAFSWLVGSWFARYWMLANGAARHEFEAGLRRLDLWAAGMTVTASALALLIATAVMGDVGLRQACPMFWMMLTSTAYGHAGGLTIVAMLMLLTLRWGGGTGRASDIGVAVALTVFAITRASMGHAGEEGLLSVVLTAEALHYAAIALWTGAVLVSAWCALSDSRTVRATAGGHDRYLDRMSQAATLAVAVIFVTGVYSAWHRVGSAEHLQHAFYGMTLMVKVALVLVAIALGGYNKFWGLPAASRSAEALHRVRAALRIESVVLIGAILAASILISQPPPTSM